MRSLKIMSMSLACALALSTAVYGSASVAGPAAPPPPKSKVDCIMRDGTGTVVQEHGPCDLGSDPVKGDRGTGGGGGDGGMEGCNLAYSAALRQCRKPIKPTTVEEKAYQACVNSAEKELKTCMSGQ